MSAVLRVTGEDLQYLATQLNVLADDVHGFPFINVGGMPGCGSNQVAAAADGANDHFELRALLIETELRDLADMAAHVSTTLFAQDARIAHGAGNSTNPGLI